MNKKTPIHLWQSTQTQICSLYLWACFLLLNKYLKEQEYHHPQSWLFFKRQSTLEQKQEIGYILSTLLLFFHIFFSACLQISSVQFSHSVVSYSLQPRGLQHARLLRLSPGPVACSNSCPSSRWCHPTISSSVNPFSSCLQPCPESGSFPISQSFASGGQSIGVLASASVFPMNIQDWVPLRLTGLISLQSKGLSRVFSNTTVQKHQFHTTQLSLRSNSHPYMITGKTIALTRLTFVSKVISLLSNMLSRFVIAFLPRSMCLLISRLQSASAVIL